MSWPGSPRGFQRLDDVNADDGEAYIDQSAAAGDAIASKRKKHYLKFLSRSKKQTSAVSSKSRLVQKESTKKATKKLAPDRTANTSSTASEQSSGLSANAQNQKEEQEKKATDTNAGVSARDDAAEQSTSREVEAISTEGGREERDGPPDAPQDQHASDAVLQKPYIVRREEQSSLALVVHNDHKYSGELMLDPSAPPPAWCANITVVDDAAFGEGAVTPGSGGPPTTTTPTNHTTSSFSPSVHAAPRPEVSPVASASEALFTDNLGQKPTTTPTEHQRTASVDFGPTLSSTVQGHPNLMRTTSEDATGRPSSPFDLRMSRSEECFDSATKRESASPARSGKKPRARPSPEMGMRPPRRTSASGGVGTPTLKSASPKPDTTPRRSTPNVSPVPNRGRASPKPPRPYGQSVLGSLVGGDNNKASISGNQKAKNPFDQLPSTEPLSSSPNPFDQFAPVFPSLDMDGGSATKAQLKPTGTIQRNPTVASSKESPFSVLDRAVITIQSGMRGHLARQDALIRMGSIVMIQSAIRRHRAVVDGFSRRGAIVSIQAWYRGELVRNEMEYLQWCAIQIQSSWRQKVARRDYGSTRAKLVVAQSLWRGHVAQKNYRNRKEQVTKIQALARQRAAEKSLQKSRDAAISIQASVRGATCRKEFEEAVSSVIRIQTLARASVARTEYISTVQAVVRLQALARRRAAKIHFDASRAAASAIQASFRGAACRREYDKTISSLILIQAIVRTSLMRGSYTATIGAVVRLQAFAREVEAKKKYQSIITGSIKLQAIARRIATQRRYDATRRVAIVSQSFARQIKARREYLSAIKAIVLLQSTARMASERRKYSAVCLSVIRAQACIRRTIAERRAARRREEVRVVAQQNHAAVVVQSYWRRFVAKEEFAESIVSALLIQMYWRRHQAICKVERLKAERERRLQLELEEQRNNAATLIQSTWRGYYHEMAYVDAIIAATIIQAYTRRYMSQCAYSKQLQIYKEEQAREQQRAAERETLRRSAMAAQRRKLEQERLEAERLKREERERAEKQRLEAERLRQEERERKEQERLETERLRQEERQRNEQKRVEVEREERARPEAERIRKDEKEKQKLEADIAAEFEKTRIIEKEKNEAESRRRIEVQKRQEIAERSAVRPSEGPLSPPKRSVIATGASLSIKDRIRMFSSGSVAASPPPVPVPLGRSAFPHQKPTLRVTSPNVAAKTTPVVEASANTPASPKSPLPQQRKSSDKVSACHQLPFKPVKESLSPVPVKTFVRSPTKAATSPIITSAQSPVKTTLSARPSSSSKTPVQPVRSDTTRSKGIGRMVQTALSPAGVPPLASPSPPARTNTEVSHFASRRISPHKSQPTASGGSSFDFNQIKNRFDTDKKSAVTESTPGNDNVQKSNHRSPQFQRKTKTQIVARKVSQIPPAKQVETETGERTEVAAAKDCFGQSPKQQHNKFPVKRHTSASQPIHNTDGWEDFGSTPPFNNSFGSASPSWKKPQLKSRTGVDSCPDDVLNSFKQIQARASPSWKKPQLQSRTEVDSCPDDVLNSFKQIQARASPSWKKPQLQSRTEVDSCPDDVLNSFKQIQASTAKYARNPSTIASPTAGPSPTANRGEPITEQAPHERPSNTFKLRPSRRDTPAADHHIPNQLPSPSTKPRAVSQTKGKTYQGDNSWRRDMR